MPNGIEGRTATEVMFSEIQRRLTSIENRLNAGSDRGKETREKISKLDGKLAALEARQPIILWVLGALITAILTQFF